MIGLAVGATLELFGSALPTDAYVLSFSAHETVSRPYRVQIRFETADDNLDLSRCIRTRAVLAATDASRQVRYFDGFIENAAFVGLALNRLVFEIELRPRLYALTHRADHRIFQQQSIPDVVKTVFSETGVDPVDWRLNRNHGQREMVAQYGESTLAFVSRLLEEAGIFYYFLHGVDGHRLVLCDSIEGFTPSASAPVLSLSPQQGSRAEPLRRFSRRRTLRTTSVLLRDYDFEKPGAYGEGRAAARDNWRQDYYEYPARVLPEAELKELAKVRLAELRSDADVCEGTSGSLGIEVGCTFTVTGGQHDELDGEYIATSLQTNGSQRNQDGKADFHCSNRFRGILAGAPFAPARSTPRPRIEGHQTAFVTGDDNADQAIFTDSYGRIKVRFHWDRVNQRDSGSSPWIRTSQIPLGGAMVIPRVGWEVSVTFLEGDPDRPLVLGRTYNSENAPPLGLPAGKASSSLESMSSPGGAGSNKISMGDSGGSQGLGISAQKDLNITTGNNCSVSVAVDDSHEVNSNYSWTVKADDKLTIGGNQEISIGANLSTKVGGSQSITVGAEDTTNATGNYLEQIGGSRAYTVGANSILVCNGIEREVTGDLSRKAGAAQIIVAVDSISDNVMSSCTSNVGAVRIHVTGGSHGETVGGAKSELEAAAAVHLTSTDYGTESAGLLSYMVGGIHLRKINQDYVVKAPVIALLGAAGQLKVGGTKVSLNGGPIKIKASKVTVEAALVRRTGGTIKFA